MHLPRRGPAICAAFAMAALVFLAPLPAAAKDMLEKDAPVEALARYVIGQVMSVNQPPKASG